MAAQNVLGVFYVRQRIAARMNGRLTAVRFVSHVLGMVLRGGICRS
ncbi:MAG: hypothetical protein H6656_11960 [Ardenticatenaceae bacterium]|nr:hypothetical protein [Ardenticatenaceae bacterium]